MFKYFLKRLAQMLVTLFIVSILVFVLANFIGDPVNMLVSPKAPPEVREQVREELGLNRPILEQYVSFVTNAVKGDFGKSYIYKVDVLSLIAQRVPATLELVFVSVVLALVISIPLGVYAGAFPKRKSSTLVMGGSILGISLPSFFIGIMLIYIFSLKLHWFPSSGRGATAPFLGMNFSLFAPGGLKYIILPAFTLSVTNIASLVRLTRAGVMENMRQDYIKFARAKGVSTRKVLFGHALKNALIPVITVFGMEIGSLIAFTTVTETIFSWPGLGKLLIDSIILVALFIMTMFGRGVSKLLVVFTIIGCVTYVRTVRAEVLTVKQMEYVDAARVIGIPNILIIAKHVLPNVMTTVIVISTMKVGGLILAEATLSFLGAGVPVTEPSLGMLVKNGFDVLFSGYWWIAVMPGLYIMLIVFGINLLGDFLRDEFNPKLK